MLTECCGKSDGVRTMAMGHRLTLSRSASVFAKAARHVVVAAADSGCDEAAHY